MQCVIFLLTFYREKEVVSCVPLKSGRRQGRQATPGPIPAGILLNHALVALLSFPWLCVSPSFSCPGQAAKGVLDKGVQMPNM